jgi:cell division protein FtsA
MNSDLNRDEANNIVVGLDIGTTKISAIVGKRNEHGKIEVIGVGRADSNGVMRGVVANIEKTVNAIKAAVAEASEKSGFDIKEVYVGIAGQHISSLQHRGILMRENIEEEISNDDIERLIKEMHRLQLNPGEKIIDVLPQEFIVDNEPGIKEPVGMSGVRLEANFHIIIGQISAIKNIYKCVQKAGLEVKDLFLEPLASSASVLNNEELEAGVALVDIGGGTTDIAIFQDEIIRHTCVIPFGGNIVTEDIKEGCMIMRNQAEQLKVKFGSALGIEASDNEIVSIPGLRGQNPREISVKNLANIIQARMEEIMEHVFFEIKSTGFGNKLIGGIVLTGGGSMLTNLVQLVEYITGMSARIGYPTEHLTKGNFDDVRHPMYATGIGLIIKGFEDQDEKAKREARKKAKVVGVSDQGESTEEEHEFESKSTNGKWYHKIMDIGSRFFNEEDKDFE